jgi:predicted lipid-binding transport protein (Tim44 family)
MTTGISAFLIFLSMCLSLGALSLGCAAPRSSTRAVSQAELAVQDATVSEADAFAPVDVRLAREKLDRAQAAYDDGDYDRARRLAEEALVDAQLAEARAENESATSEARQLESEVEVLHRRFPDRDHDHDHDVEIEVDD